MGGGAEVSVTNGSGIPKPPRVKISRMGVTGTPKHGVMCTLNTVQDHHRNNNTCHTHYIGVFVVSYKEHSSMGTAPHRYHSRCICIVTNSKEQGNRGTALHSYHS